MAIDKCDPCAQKCWGQVGAEQFYNMALLILCQIKANTAGGGGGGAVPVSSAFEDLVSVNTVSQVVLPANASRRGGWVKNISEQYIWVSLSGTASLTDPSKLAPGESVRFDSATYIYDGAVSAITNSGTADLEVVEL